MPAQVYLRGFLVEVARFLKLDVQHVTRSYLARYAKGKAARLKRAATACRRRGGSDCPAG